MKTNVQILIELKRCCLYLGWIVCAQLAWAQTERAKLEWVGEWPGSDGIPYCIWDFTDVVVSGSYAYLTGWGGLQVIDISDPVHLQPVGSCALDTSGYAYGVAVSGNYAYVADGYVGLQVIDVSDPVNPQRVGGYATSGGATGVAVSGNYAYVADGYVGLQVIDVSDPTNPQRVGGYDTSGSADGVAVNGNYAYVADSDAGLQVIDVSDPANPQRVGGCDTSGYAERVAVSGNYAYVADWGFQVVDVSNPANPQRVGTCSVDFATGVTVTGTYAYVSCEDGLAAVDISNPAAPTPISGYYSTGGAYDVVVCGHYAYVVNVSWTQLLYMGGRVQVLDIADPASPKQVACIPSSGWPCLAISGTVALLATRDGLQVIDISDPTHPRQIGRYETGGAGVAVIGDYACLAGGAGLQVLDISEPSNPWLVGADSSTQSGQEVVVSGDYAYVLTGAPSNGLAVVDLSRPDAPQRVGDYHPGSASFGQARPEAPGARVSSMTAHGNYLYVPNGEGGLLVLEMSNPSDLRLVGHYNSGLGGGPVAVSGRYAYMIAGVFRWLAKGRLEVLDMANPARPSRVAAHQIGEGMGVAVSGNHVYVADANAGLQVFRIEFAAFTGLSVQDAQLVLQWNELAKGMTLQRATSLTNPDWQDLPGYEEADRATLPLGSGPEFFRLVGP